MTTKKRDRIEFDIDNRLGTLATRLSCVLQMGSDQELREEAKAISEELSYLDKTYKLK